MKTFPPCPRIGDPAYRYKIDCLRRTLICHSPARLLLGDLGLPGFPNRLHLLSVLDQTLQKSRLLSTRHPRGRRRRLAPGWMGRPLSVTHARVHYLLSPPCCLQWKEVKRSSDCGPARTIRASALAPRLGFRHLIAGHHYLRPLRDPHPSLR